MQPHQIKEALERIATSEHFADDACLLVEQWEGADIGIEAVEPILRFIEEHPGVDFGAPGPLVHFVERFYKNGYEDRLVASLGRRPTRHTVWMLQRIVNDTDLPVKREHLIASLVAATHHPEADEFTIERAASFAKNVGARPLRDEVHRARCNTR